MELSIGIRLEKKEILGGQVMENGESRDARAFLTTCGRNENGVKLQGPPHSISRDQL